MLSDLSIPSTLVFLVFAYLLIGLQFRDGGNKRRSLYVCASILIAGIACKIGYDLYDRPTNFYTVLEVGKLSSPLEIRQSYKKVSRKYHPDKNTAANAEEVFARIKFAYDVLMDESQRAIYDRFGEAHIESDPRLDELKLLSSIAAVYLFWAVITYMFTLPVGAQAARSWITILGVILLIAEVVLCITETSLPSWLPDKITEGELILYIHLGFPAAIALLRCLSEYLYVDIDKVSVDVLTQITNHQKAVGGLLHQLHVLTADPNGYLIGSGSEEDRRRNLEAFSSKLTDLRTEMENSDESISQTIETLRRASSNPGAQYYWLVFVFMYAGVYLFQ